MAPFRFRPLALVALLATPVAGWGSAARAEVPDVVADIPPVHSLVALVMGDLGTPFLLLGPGADPHSYQLRPSEARALGDARLIFRVGPEMTPWLDRAVGALAPEAEAVVLLDAPGTRLRMLAGGPGEDHEGEHDEADGEEDGAGHGDESGAAAAAHAHSGRDPHAWLDPANARAWLAAIADRLAAADPANAATYEANARAATARIAAAETALAARLAPVAGRRFVVAHDAYGYFTDRFGLGPVRALAEGDAAAPGAARLAAIRDGIAAEGAVCLFPEARRDPALAEALIEGTGLRLGGPLDPEGAAIAPGPALYEALIDSLATTLAACLAP